MLARELELGGIRPVVCQRRPKIDPFSTVEN